MLATATFLYPNRHPSPAYVGIPESSSDIILIFTDSLSYHTIQLIIINRTSTRLIHHHYIIYDSKDQEQLNSTRLNKNTESIQSLLLRNP